MEVGLWDGSVKQMCRWFIMILDFKRPIIRTTCHLLPTCEGLLVAAITKSIDFLYFPVSSIHS